MKNETISPNEMTFDAFRAFIKTIEAPAQRLGIFRLQIKNRGKEYCFEHLKESASFNNDLCGFGLNHYGWLGLPKQKYKQSKFHDEEDVSVSIYREEFIMANKILNENRIILKTKNWNGEVSW